MSTSATITNSMVRNNSLPERPIRSVRAAGGAACPLIGSVTGSKKSSTEESQPANDAPHPRTGQTRGEKDDRGPFPDLGQRRIRQDDPRHGPDIQLLGNRERPGRDQLARLRADDCGTEDATFGRSDDLYMTVYVAFGMGAVIVVIGTAQYP